MQQFAIISLHKRKLLDKNNIQDDFPEISDGLLLEHG